MKEAIDALLRLAPTTERQLALIAQVSSTRELVLMDELRQQLAVRTAYLLLGHVSDASNYEVIERRLKRIIGADVPRALVDGLANAVVAMGASADSRRSTLNEIPYPARNAMLNRQGGRCDHCGWSFREARDEQEAVARQPTVDHVVPYRLGGESMQNLRILCALCNSMKEATLHVGEHGRAWINNHAYAPPPRRIVYWAIARARSRCSVPDCESNSRTSRLYAVRRASHAAPVLDNCVVLCEGHADGADIIEY